MIGALTATARRLARDPWVLGSVGLLLLGRSFEGIRQQARELQKELAEVGAHAAAVAAGTPPAVGLVEAQHNGAAAAPQPDGDEPAGTTVPEPA